MGRQVGMFCIEDDERELLNECDRVSLRVIPGEINTNEVIAPLSPRTINPSRDYSVLYFLPANVPLSAVIYEQMADPSRSVLMPSKSAALELVTCRRDGDTIEDGRIYFDTPKSNPFFAEVRLNFERLSRFIKSWSRTDQFNFYVGPAAVEAVHAGKLRLRHGRHELRPVA